MSFFIPVEDIDTELLDELIDVFEQFHDESEVIAINLEQNRDKTELIIALRYLVEGVLYKSVKLNVTLISESLSETMALLELLVEWKLFPEQMSDFLLLLVDRIFIMAKDIALEHHIDIRKAQQILIPLQKLRRVYEKGQIEGAVKAAIAELTAPYSDLFGREVEIFGELSCIYAPQETSSEALPHVQKPIVDTVVSEKKSAQTFDVMYNPVLQAREWIAQEFSQSPLASINMIAERVVTKNQTEETKNLYTVLELAVATNILAGEPLPLQDLAVGISFRDIALAEIPHVLNKSEKLSDAEFSLIRKHPMKSAALLRMFNDSEVAAQVVLEHHERVNGTGYPFGLREDNISDAGKLVAIVDSFNGMVKSRPHKRFSKGILRAISEINASTQTLYDPRWVKLFNRCLREYWLPLNHD